MIVETKYISYRICQFKERLLIAENVVFIQNLKTFSGDTMLDQGKQPSFFCRLLEAGSIEKEASCIPTLERTGFLRSYKCNFHIARKTLQNVSRKKDISKLTKMLKIVQHYHFLQSLERTQSVMV